MRRKRQIKVKSFAVENDRAEQNSAEKYVADTQSDTLQILNKNTSV